MSNNLKWLQLINTAIIKNKESQIHSSFDERMNQIVERPAIDSIGKAITHLAELQKIPHDQAAIEIIETIRSLDKIWNDYVILEGIEKLRDNLKSENININ